MEIISVLFAISPVIVIFLLMNQFKLSADMSGLIGWIYTSLLAIFIFHTDWRVVLIASIVGILQSFPISIMVVTSIFQINIMEEAGAIKRLVVFMKTLAHGNREVQVMLINVGFGTMLAALGATPVSILPPIMLSLGYSAFVSIALPAIGYDALCTYALLAVPIEIFTGVINGILKPETPYTVSQLGLYFANYMPVVTSCIALAMLYLVGGWREIRKGWFVALLTGFFAGFSAIAVNKIAVIANMEGLIRLTGIIAGAVVIFVMLLYIKLTGKQTIDRSQLTDSDKRIERSMPLWISVIPWLMLIVFSAIINLDTFKNLLQKTLGVNIALIPGDKPMNIMPMWHAYTWILITTILALPFYKIAADRFKIAMQKTVKRTPRPAFAAAIFFAIAGVLNHSGKIVSADPSGKDVWTLVDPSQNMIAIIAKSASETLNQFYLACAPYLGLLGGFISGSEASSIAMLSKLHIDAANLIYNTLPPVEILPIAILIAAASGIGGGLASVISPAKLQNASAVIDRIGMESIVIKSAVVISLSITLVVAIMTFLFIHFKLYPTL